MDKEHKELTINFKRALNSIFRVFDKDNDGYLSKEDMYSFYVSK
jgi:Ca2+-binding EF-hand superfamily protein